MRRRIELLDDGTCHLWLGRSFYRLPRHRFWQRFEQWEPDTLRAYRQYVQPGGTVVDIGAWIGPTILFADACGAGRITALEPNPDSCRRLEELFRLNPHLAEAVSLLPMAVCPGRKTISLGQPDDDCDSSLFGIRGNGLVADCIGLVELFEKGRFGPVDLLKIDVEGAEILLAEDFRQLPHYPVRTIHLSVHGPFWPTNADPADLVDALAGYKAMDDRGARLSSAQLQQRLTSHCKRPDWGTRHGNFFEFVLQPA